jgi:hypothetical protein
MDNTFGWNISLKLTNVLKYVTKEVHIWVVEIVKN